ncbi:MAG: META domain-containing protein [Actinomycetota bacterium]
MSTEEVDDGIFIVTGYSFCVPAEVELASIDVAGTLGGDWRLIDSTPELGIRVDAEVRLTITDERAGGWAVCNEYWGLVAAGPEGAWRISELGSTEIACAEAESAYFDRLGATTSWSIDGLDLVLEGPDGTLRYVSE